MTRLLVVAVVGAALVATVVGQDEGKRPVCSFNEVYNGQICTCAAGYFKSSVEESRSHCEDECEEVYSSFFTSGKCVKDIFGRIAKEDQPACNMRCGMRLRVWTTIGLFVVAAAAVATLVFTIPMCIATCCSCLQAKKANKNAKRVFNESQSTKGQEVAAVGYNPYAYWPYYGRA